VAPSTLVATPLPWISKGSPLPPSPSPLFLPQPRSCTTLGSSSHPLLQYYNPAPNTLFLLDVSGQVAFEEEQPKVFPVDAFNDDVIKMASSQLVASHAANFLDQRILRQRHQVRIVPVTRVNYDWKGRGRSYYVYGYENKVHLPGGSYPQACCWGCALM